MMIGISVAEQFDIIFEKIGGTYFFDPCTNAVFTIDLQGPTTLYGASKKKEKFLSKGE